MGQNHGFSRRAFLRNAPLTALVGAVGTGGSLAMAAAADSAATLPNGKYDFDTPYNRVGSDCIKWDMPMRQFHVDHLVAGMGIADMDFRAAPCINKALAERMKHENWGYLDLPRSFPESIIAWNKRRYGIDINPDLLGITTGVHPGIIATLHAFAPPGSKVLLTTPTYNGFYGDINFCRLKPEESPMHLVNGRYSIDFEDLERRISHDTNVLILCNPQNPTGNCWSREDLTRLGEICLRRRVIVLADEIHCDFVTKGQKYTPFSTLENRDIVNNSITFKAASKSFSLAAMKCAWFFTTNPEIFAAVKANNRADLTTLGMIANHAVLTEGEEWLDQLLPYIDGNHEFAVSYIQDKIPMLKAVKPQGTYLSWLDVTQVAEKIHAKEQAVEANKSLAPGARPTTPEMVVERWFVENAKVNLNAGNTYGLGGANHMRMNIATSRRTLESALSSMASALKQV